MSQPRPDVAVVIPFQTDAGGWRDQALAWVVARWGETHPDWPVIVGQLQPDEPWCKGRAIAVALEYTSASVLVISDADVWCGSITDAVSSVVAGSRRWAISHKSVLRLGPEATLQTLAGPKIVRGALDRPGYLGTDGGGLVVVQRTLYEEAPFDPRYEGWGHEDETVGLCWRVLGGQPWRGGADLWHLWHEPQPKLSAGVGSATSKNLLTRYRAAEQHPEQLRMILQEIPNAVRM